MSNPIFYEGQAVGCLVRGEGVVDEVNQVSEGSVYVISVKFKDGKSDDYCDDGRYFENKGYTLYPIDQYREIIANLPSPQPEPWKPKPGEWCWFWDNEYRCAVLNVLESIEADKRFPYLSKTGAGYDNCAQFIGELPEHLKEVQP